MNPLEQFKDSNSHIRPQEHTASPQAKDGWKKMGCEEKKAAVHEEMKRMNKLPANSTYATHRLRVLNKILQLLSIQVMDVSYQSSLAKSLHKNGRMLTSLACLDVMLVNTPCSLLQDILCDEQDGGDA
ncbi:uncharacterized protein LOC114324028 isoform X4 [Camellia sinensis]|uniref:uncharacterized protein LOC114324028 isoform X3 n=1 Tax=Camellia sinensis TaxID=4442 RepID=UPI0010363B26|nr:uncharacterized protein LOC114324028 isoform X3 [Camellia sinensis]XP_028127554.1 uncharacterized protein LOC114324028 isoform X4 [Camellia sinensis]